jgi:hypothetical protein
MVDIPVPELKYWTQRLASLNSQSHVITNKFPEGGAVVQEVHKALNDTEILAGCTPAKAGEGSEWIAVVNSAEASRANFCKDLNGKPLFSAYTACTR